MVQEHAKREDTKLYWVLKVFLGLLEIGDAMSSSFERSPEKTFDGYFILPLIGGRLLASPVGWFFVMGEKGMVLRVAVPSTGAKGGRTRTPLVDGRAKVEGVGVIHESSVRVSAAGREKADFVKLAVMAADQVSQSVDATASHAVIEITFQLYQSSTPTLLHLRARVCCRNDSEQTLENQELFDKPAP